MSTLIKNDLLSQYPAFSFLKWMRRFNIESVSIQNLILTITFILLLILSSIIDNSLILKNPNIGLLQHPAIWTFFLIQAIVPFFISTSLSRFLNMSNWEYCIISKSFFNNWFEKEVNDLKEDVLRKSVKSRLTFIILSFIGVIAFIWNTYQNQDPFKFLGFDFWDSYNYPFGYWVTRLYKLYIWCLFFPSIIHLYSFIVIKTLKTIKIANSHHLLKIEPYHYDNHGGVSIIVKNIIRPIIPVLFITSLLSIFVFIVHNKFDFTSVSSLIIATIFLFIFYFIPAFMIRDIIKKEKERQLAEIGIKQQKLLKSITSNDDNDSIKNNYEIIDLLNSIATKINSIPNWPSNKLIIKILSIAYSPTIINIIIKFIIPKFL